MSGLHIVITQNGKQIDEDICENDQDAAKECLGFLIDDLEIKSGIVITITETEIED